jgi:cytochrome d ubiquinol oxidase subunit I
MIALHFFSIVAYWYGWDRWSLGTHNLIGLALGVSALLIPFGFRGVFAFLNIPAGLTVEATPSGIRYGLDLAAAVFANPTTLPLYVKSIVAAFTVTFFAVMGGYAYRYATAGSEEDRRVAARAMMMMAKPAAIGAVLMILLGLWYSISLQAVPYKFNNVFASLGWRTGPDPTPYYNVAWLFVLKMLFFAVQLAAVALVIPKLLRGEQLSHGQLRLLLAAGIAAVLTVPLGEYLNAFSQYPFFIAAWPNVLAGHVTPQQLVEDYGVKITPPEALPAVIEKVNSIVLVDGAGSSAVGVLEKLVDKYPDNPYFRALLAEAQISVNEVALIAPVVYLTYAFIAFLTAAAVYLLYILLVPRQVRTTAAIEETE